MRVSPSDLKQPDLKLQGIYRGVVEDNADPNAAGRCRVRIFGVHSSSAVGTSTEGIATEDLPWAEPVLGLIEGSISGYGLFSVPLQGSHVFCFFESGNHMMPRYFGSAPGTVATAAAPAVTGETQAFKDPDGVYPDATGVDFNTGEGTYPHNIVLKTHAGHIIEIDSTPGANRLHVKHATGYDVVIDNSSNITLISPGNRTVTIGGTDTLITTGSRTVTVGSGDTLGITGNWNVTVAGNANITVTGICNIRGAPVNIN
jgi:hypothetical protein